MQLVHPYALLIGLAGLALPLVVHWLTRPRPRKMPISTLKFIRELVHQRRATYRLRDLLVLALRMAAVACLALAFARPLGEDQPLVAAEASGSVTRIVLLDRSQSMAAVSGGVSAFERARSIAGRYIDYSGGLQANLLLCASECQSVFDRPSANFAVLREQLAQAKVRPQKLNAQAAINTAAAMFQATASQGTPTQGPRRELLIISDFQRSNWASVDLSALPEDVVISFQTSAASAKPANLAVTAVRFPGRAQQGRQLRGEVEIGNYSPAGREVQVEVLANGQTQRISGFCPPGTRTALPLVLEVEQAGWCWGEAKIVTAEDALPADDVRAFALQVHRTPTYLLLTRQSSRPQAASSHYLERALSPHTGLSQAKVEQVVRVDPLALELGQLASADLVVLDHPGLLSEEQVSWLAGILRRGRGVFYVACEAADAVNLTRLASAAGSDLQMPVEFAPAPTGSGAPVTPALFWGEYRKDLPPFSSFGQTMQQAVGELRFASGLVSRQLDTGVSSDVLASYSDRSAALMQTACGSGMLVVLNADLTRSNLPSSPLFPALVSEIAQRLAQQRGASALEVGEAAMAWLPPDQVQATGLKIRAPEFVRPEDSGSIVLDGQQVSWRCSSVPQVGVYRIAREEQVVFAAAAGIADQESDLETLDPEVLVKRLAAGHAAEFRSGATPMQPTEWWPWLLVACAGLMVAEWSTLRVFRS